MGSLLSLSSVSQRVEVRVEAAYGETERWR